MKRTSSILLLALMLGLLLPTFAVATDNKMIMKGGGGGPPSSTTYQVEYYTGSGQDKWAVLIGIADYDGRSNDLWNMANDALEMRAILEADGYNWAFAQDSAGTQANFEIMLNWL
ncbi:MAG: caspase family protein, partial [Candidatus Thorarchaeota archaeon]|nr:caspase family protein [Candidatus Thorarchaeota archaeon]